MTVYGIVVHSNTLMSRAQKLLGTLDIEPDEIQVMCRKHVLHYHDIFEDFIDHFF